MAFQGQQTVSAHSSASESHQSTCELATNGFTNRDYQNFAASFITSEIATAAKLRRAEDIEGAELIGRKPRAGTKYSGIIFPYFIPGEDYPREYRLRRDVPDFESQEDGSTKERAKYVSSPGARNMLYFAPGTSVELLNDVSLPIVIVEGEKKSLAMYRLAAETIIAGKSRFLSIGLSGVWNFRGTVGKATIDGARQDVKGTIPDFQLLKLKGRKVIILFDSNVRSNSDVKSARFHLAKVLKDKGAKVFFADLPQECEENNLNGVDDYLGFIEKEEGVQSALKAGIQLIEDAYQPKRAVSPMAKNFELITSGSKEPGVYFTEDSGERLLVCSPLEVVAVTRTETGENYGRLLKWKDLEDRVHTWAMPMPLVHSEGSDLVKYLVSRGLMIGASRNHHDKLKNYINLSQPDERISCTDRIGWHDEVFVFPDETIGANENKVVYQPEYTPAHKFGVKGTLSDWRENLSKFCVGNSRLAFGVSIAFAASLLPIVEMQSGGFHNRGGTSSGKTTVSFVSGSVYGGSTDELGYCQSWKATANGLESVAEMHNHSLLCLDELAQIDGRQAGDIAYMLANGEGKKRMAKTVTARRSLSWQLLFLSTGEISLADKMSEAGQTIKGGQEVRILDIPADTGKHGVFESLHEFPDGQTFADHLRSAARKFYGTPIRAFIGGITGIEVDQIRTGWQEFKERFVSKVLPKKKQPSEVYRAAARFALVAFAGETATKLQITGWNHGEASRAAEIVFRAWFDNRSGRGGSDAERAISQIRAFIEAHGSSRFEMLTINEESLDTSKIINRAGFRKKNDEDELEYLFLPEIFRSEVCKGFDHKLVCKTLDERGYLRHDSAGFQKQLKYGGVQIRPYWVSSKILSGNDEGDEMEHAESAGV